MKWRRAPWMLLAWMACLAPPPAAHAHGDEAHPIWLAHGAWFDGHRFTQRDFYSVGGELRLHYEGPVDDTLDLSGRFVVAPFADAHTHAFSDTSDNRRDERRFLSAGILYAKNPNNPTSRVAAVRALVNRARTADVIFANGGLTSSGGHPAQIYEGGDPRSSRWEDDAYFTADDDRQLERKWPRVLAGRPDFIKVYLESSEFHMSRRGREEFFGRRGLDPALLPDVIAYAHRAGLEVSCHVTTGADFHAAVAAGVDEINHLPLAAITEGDARDAARRGIVLVTTLVSHRAPEGTDLDSLHRENLERLMKAGVRLALGTDHPTRTVLDEAERLRSLAIFDEAALLRLLTYETARAIFPQRRLGPFEHGVEASFLVLEGDPLRDPSNLRRVLLRFKRGVPIEPPAAPQTKPSVAEAMMGPLMQGDLSGALALYDRLEREQTDQYDFGEQALNQLGYALLRHGATANAVAVFLKNAEVFPESPNVYDSLADGYLAAGDSARAATAYDRALEALTRDTSARPEFRRQLEARARERLARLRRRGD